MWAQYAEDFELEQLPSGWTTHVIGTGSWEFGNNIPPFFDDPIFDSGAAVFDDGVWGGDARPVIAYLTSPVYTHPNQCKVRVAFDYYLNTYGEWGTLMVQIYLVGKWVTRFVANWDQTTMEQFWFEASVSAASPVQVRFVFLDNGGWSWGTAIDNFTLDFQPVPSRRF